jgi:hypothetical protein
MPTVLSDPAPVLLVIYAIAALVALGVWYRRRDRKSQIALAATLAIVAALIGLSVWFESPREVAIRRVNGVIAAMNRYDTGAAVEHVSDRFDYRGVKKTGLRNAALNQILREYQAKIAPWDFDRNDVTYDSAGAVTIGFCVNVKGSLGSRPGFYVRATCVKDPDGEYRLSGFKVHESALQKAKSQEFIVPGMNP